MRFVARKWWTALGSTAGALSVAAAAAAPVASVASVASIVTVVTVVGGVSSVTACGDDCFCTSPEVDVVVAPANAAEVMSVSASGTACAAVTGSCDQQGTTGCVDYAVVPTMAGDCAVTVAFTDGSVQSQTFTFGGTPTCCGDLGGGGELDVVAPAGGGAPAGDAG